jgi:hypothetical protein
LPKLDLVDEDCKTPIDLETYEPHEMCQSWEFNEPDGVERTNYPMFEFAIATRGLCPLIGGFNSVWKRLE